MSISKQINNATFNKTDIHIFGYVNTLIITTKSIKNIYKTEMQTNKFPALLYCFYFKYLVYM